MSAGLRTNDSATMSTRRPSANARSAQSFSDIAGTDTFMPGSERPLLSLTGPPSVTSQTTSLPSTATTRRPTLPSSTSSRSSGRASAARPLYVVDTRSWVPATSSAVIRTCSPVRHSSEPGPVANRPSRIFGPWRSARIPTAWPSASAASRIMS